MREKREAICNAKSEKAIFGMGCFWCAQSDFDKLPGVLNTLVGYDGGEIPDPTYEQVCTGTTAYVEVIQVTFDPEKITYVQILDYFWRHMDPTVQNGQFCDIGSQYQSAIFYLNDIQKKYALASLEKIKAQFLKVHTEVRPSTHFYPAEAYHQEFYKKNVEHYENYRVGSGRDARLKELWKNK